MHPCRPIAALLASAFSLAAQDAPALTGRSFLPAEHTLAARVDVEALLETDLYDVLERSPAKLLLEEFRKTFGFHIDDLTRFEAAMRFHPETEGARPRQSAVIVLHGNEKVCLDDADIQGMGGGRYEWTEIAGQKVLTGSEPAMLAPRSGLLVFGDSHHIEGILRGEVRGGVPTPELMPLLAGGKALAYFAMLLDTPDAKQVWPGEWSDPADPIHHLAARLERRAADDHLVLTARAGFETGEVGPALLSEKIDEGTAMTKESAEMRPLLPLFERLVKKHEGRELIVELDLGEGGAGLQQLTQALIMGFLVPRRAAAEAMAIEAEKRAAEVEEMVKKMQKAQERARKAQEEKGAETEKKGKEEGKKK